MTPADARTPLRVLWITTTARGDGPGRALAAVLRHWDRADEIAVCTLSGVSPSFAGGVPSRVTCHDLRLRGIWDPRGVRAVERFCRAWQPDLVQAQLSRADWLARPVARALGRPVVSTIQNVHARMYAAEFPWIVGQGGRLLDRLTARFVTQFIAVSRGVRDDLLREGIAAARIAVIPNAVDLGTFAASASRDALRTSWGCAPDDVVVGTVALLKTQKGLAHLVDAAAASLQRDSRLRFIQVGSGPLEAALKQRAESLGLADRFLFLGQHDEPRALLAGFDVFVLPSLWEGLPLALLEAMDAGLPCIASRVSGIEDVLEDARTGVLVPAGDVPALAAAITSLAADPSRRAAMGLAGRTAVAAFDARHVAERIRRMYLRLPIEKPIR